MTIRLAILLALILLFLPLTVCAAPTVGFPVLEQFRIPPYPYLARLAKTEGTIGVDVDLDTRCNVLELRVGKGEPRLVEAVKRSLYEGSEALRFRPCALSQAAAVRLSYTFSLQGQATNRWSQTEVRVSTDGGKSFQIKITTAPPDLEALGLQRVKEQSKVGKNSGTEANTRHNENLDTVESNAREEGTDRPGQTTFISPNYFASAGNIQGDVKIEVELDPDCRVSNAKTLSGHVLLTEEVLRAVREWQFPGCSSGKSTLELVFHFLLTEPDSPSPYGNWAPTHFEMVSPYEFKIRTVGPDLIIYDEFRIQ